MLKFLSSMICTSRIHPFSLGNYLRTSLIIGNLMIIRVTSVEWTWFRVRGASSLVCCLLCTLLDSCNLQSLCTLLHSCSFQFNLLADFVLVDEREKKRMREESDELGALISKLRLGDDEMSIETYIHMEGEEITELELTTDELVDAALGVNHAQGFDLNVDLHSVDVDDVAPPTVKLSDAKHHASLLSNFLLDNSLHFDVNEIISFQKLVGNLERMTIANLDG